MIEVSDQNQDLQVKFMAKFLNNNFNQSLRDDIVFVPVNDVLCTFISLNVQSAAARGYCLSKTEFNKVFNLLDEFVA